ncbi:hypothetical protein Glove_229g42 [Diversispora epigaea]|uniref:Uncharacterized protein n=1 Tax=Diversispora epigaea TaxID=1348612 RepID=A0A397IM51_9GLOM|nr:hypothetical protein Glove_229g42 [Diversispora epigaea]
MEIDFEEKLEKSQENINQMKKEIDFLANINQQFSAENNQLIKNLDRFRKYRILESISVRSSPGKRVFGNDLEKEDTELDDKKNEKDVRNKMKIIIKTIDFEFTTARMRNSEKLPKDLCRVHVNNWQNNKKLRRIKAAKELFRKNNPNIINYNKESLLRMLTDRAFHSPEMFNTGEGDNSKTVLKHLLRNVLDSQLVSSTIAQLQRKRNYSDEIQRYDFPPPAKVPNWACNEQEDVVYDTEFVQTEGEDELSFVSTSSSKISAEQ